MQRVLVACVIGLSAFGAAACTGNGSTGNNNHSSATASVAAADSCGAPAFTADNSYDTAGVIWYSPADSWTYTPGVDDDGLSSSSDEGGQDDSAEAATDDGSADGNPADANTPPADPPPPPPPADDGSGSGGDSGSDDGSGDSWPDTFGNNGCYPCAVVCVTDDPSQTTRTAQASSSSYNGACSAAVGAIRNWAHHSMHQPLARCAQLTIR